MRLSATGLPLGKIDFTAETLEHLDHADPYLRIELVDEAGMKSETFKSESG